MSGRSSFLFGRFCTALQGGRERATRNLDSFFSQSRFLRGPSLGDFLLLPEAIFMHLPIQTQGGVGLKEEKARPFAGPAGV